MVVIVVVPGLSMNTGFRENVLCHTATEMRKIEMRKIKNISQTTKIR